MSLSLKLYFNNYVQNIFLFYKRNLYNFLVLSNQSDNKEEEEEIRHLNAVSDYQESANDLDLKRQSQFDKLWSTAIECKFPLFTSLAIVLILIFYAFKFYKKFFRLSYYKRTVQKNLSKLNTSSKKKFSKSWIFSEENLFIYKSCFFFC